MIPVDDHIEVNGINVRTMKWSGAGQQAEGTENGGDEESGVPFDED